MVSEAFPWNTLHTVWMSVYTSNRETVLRHALLCSVEPSWIISTRRMIVARCDASLSRSLSSQPQRGPPASSSTVRDCQPGLFFGHCLIIENGNVRFDVV